MHKIVQQRFFDLITAKEPLFMSKSNPIETYKELIHYRFKEVILMVFPRFLQYISEKELNTLVAEFILSKPKTPYIWKMPKEFRAFVLTKQALQERFAFLEDLLWFEWVEVELFMQNFSRSRVKPFCWNSSIKLSESTLLKTLKYAAFDDERLEIKDNYFVLLYYNFETHEVHFQELTEFLYDFLVFQQGHTLLESLEHFSAKYEASIDDIKEILEPTLASFCQQEIFYEE